MRHCVDYTEQHAYGVCSQLAVCGSSVSQFSELYVDCALAILDFLELLVNHLLVCCNHLVFLSIFLDILAVDIQDAVFTYVASKDSFLDVVTDGLS